MIITLLKKGIMCYYVTHSEHSVHYVKYFLWRNIMWTKPAATEMRFGFEVTMYINNR
jgi:coenzyme PQQ precursor peptide PqqA